MTSPVLLTGCTGLLGAHVTEQWPSDAPPLRPVSSRDVDLLNFGAPTDLVRTVHPSAIVHLAWSASGSPSYRDHPDNARWVDATLELVDAAAAADVPTWLTGTVVDLGDGPADAYTASKRQLRRAVADRVDERTIGWLRPSYVFDPVRGRPRLVDEAQQAIASDRPLTLVHPDSRHDFVHAGDVAAATILAVVRDVRGELPIGAGRTRKVTDLVAGLGARWASSDPTIHDGTAVSSRPVQTDEAADITWLHAQSWRPTRTQEFFGDE